MQQEINEYQHNFNMDRKEELITFLQSLDENHQFFYLDMKIAFHEHKIFLDTFICADENKLLRYILKTIHQHSSGPNLGHLKPQNNCKVKLTRLKSSVPNSAMIHNEWLTSRYSLIVRNFATS